MTFSAKHPITPSADRRNISKRPHAVPKNQYQSPDQYTEEIYSEAHSVPKQALPNNLIIIQK